MVEVLNRYIPAKAIVLLITENLWITGSLVLMIQLRSRYLLHEERDLVEISYKLGLVIFLCQICLFYNELYDLTVVTRRSELVIRSLQSFGAGALILGALYTLFPGLRIEGGVVAPSVILAMLTLLAWRAVVTLFSRHYGAPKRILILGTGELAVDVARAMLEHSGLNMEVVGFVTDNPAEVDVSLIKPGVVGSTSELEQLAERYHADRVVAAFSDRRKTMPLQALFNLKIHGVHIDDAHSVYERVTGKIRTTGLPASWFIFSEGFQSLGAKMQRKRALDFLLSLIAAVLSAPLAVLAAVAIKLDSHGPVLFRQERVGLHGRTFRVLKFRTMRTDAEADGIPRWAGEDDPRITRVGKFLRKARLDELPQIWNVLKGQMSFVGPRPERPHFVAQLAEQLSYYNERHAVRPGITGWAQVRYGYGATVEDALQKLQYDLFYVKNLSLLLDLVILFETGKIVLFGSGR